MSEVTHTDSLERAVECLLDAPELTQETVGEVFMLAGLDPTADEIGEVWHQAVDSAGDNEGVLRRKIREALGKRTDVAIDRSGRIVTYDTPGRILHVLIRTEFPDFDQKQIVQIIRQFLGELPDPPTHVLAQYFRGEKWKPSWAEWTEPYLTGWIAALIERGVIPNYDLSRCDLYRNRAGRDPIESKGVLLGALRVRAPRSGDGWKPYPRADDERKRTAPARPEPPRPAPPKSDQRIVIAPPIDQAEEPSLAYRLICNCGKHIRVRENFAGRRGKCPLCKKKMSVLDIGKLPTTVDRILTFAHRSKNEAKRVLETVVEKLARDVPGPACYARLSMSGTFREGLARRETDRAAFDNWWDQLPVMVRNHVKGGEWIGLYIEASRADEWERFLEPVIDQVSPKGQRQEFSLADWGNFLKTVYPIIDYALIGLDEDLAEPMPAEHRAIFKLPEAVFHGFSKEDGGDSAAFYQVARRVAEKHCKRTVYVVRLEGKETDLVTLTGRKGSLAAFHKIWGARSEALFEDAGHDPEDVRPDWSVSNLDGLKGLPQDERFHEDVRNSVLTGEYRLIDRFSIRD